MSREYREIGLRLLHWRLGVQGDGSDAGWTLLDSATGEIVAESDQFGKPGAMEAILGVLEEQARRRERARTLAAARRRRTDGQNDYGADGEEEA